MQEERFGFCTLALRRGGLLLFARKAARCLTFRPSAGCSKFPAGTVRQPCIPCCAASAVTKTRARPKRNTVALWAAFESLQYKCAAKKPPDGWFFCGGGGEILNSGFAITLFGSGLIQRNHRVFALQKLGVQTAVLQEERFGFAAINVSRCLCSALRARTAPKHGAKNASHFLNALRISTIVGEIRFLHVGSPTGRTASDARKAARCLTFRPSAGCSKFPAGTVRQPCAPHCALAPRQNTGSPKAQHRCPLDALRISSIQMRRKKTTRWVVFLCETGTKKMDFRF